MEEILIIKNNGEKEVFNPDKIHRHLKDACEGLNVDIISIIKDARLRITNNSKSIDIQNSLIKSAQEKISKEYPDYQIAAGRLLNQKLRKEVYGQFQPLNFKEQIKERIEKGYYSKDLLNYSDEELNYFGSLIDYNLDDYMTFSSLNQLYSKYLIKINGKRIETPQEIFILIPMAIFYNCEKEYRKKYIEIGYNLLSQKKISLPTPVMNGARTSYKKFISCNLINFGDSVKSLSKGIEAVMACTSDKSGLGGNVSFIRGLGASVGKPSRLEHTGILPIIKTIEAATGSLSQISRGGSITLTMPFFHYEIELFSQLSDSKGSVENRARHTDQSIIINKWFLEKALNKENIYLFHMNEVTNENRELCLYDALGDYERFDKLYNQYAKKVHSKHKKKINAFELLSLMIYERMITGRVYFVFADNFKNSPFKENLYMPNLCLEISLPSKSLDNFRNEEGEIGCCILGNMNLGYTKDFEIPIVADFLVNFLDNMIDISDFKLDSVKYAATKRRTLGIGISNLFGYLAKTKQFYNLKDTRKNIHFIMENFYFHLLKSSNELAKIKGKCELFDDTIYSEGKFIFERYNTNYEFKNELYWESLRESIKKYGLRNSTLCAIPPAGNSAEVSNSTNGVEPPRELITIKTDKNSTIKKIVPYFKSSKNYYTEVWGDDFNNKDYLKLISIIQKFTDQAISLNTYYNLLKAKNNKIDIEQILEEMIISFNLGIKTWYYATFRTQEVNDGIEENRGCESGGCSV